MCSTPTYRYVNSQFFPLNCGKCIDCLKHHQREWVFRLTMEHRYWSKLGKKSYCLTLTYDDEHCPIRYLTNAEYRNWYEVERLKGVPLSSYKSVLRYSDFQSFVKRLRDRCEVKSDNIRFFVAGEYGDTTGRCHFHVIFFGVSCDKDTFHKVSFDCWKKCDIENFRIDELSSCSIRYTTKYLNKFISTDKKVQPFIRCSQNLGLSWLTEEVKEWIYTSCPAFVMLNGYKYPLPRYYKKRVFVTDVDKERYRVEVRKKVEPMIDKKLESVNRRFNKISDIEVLHQCNNGLCRESAEKIVNYLLYRLDYTDNANQTFRRRNNPYWNVMAYIYSKRLQDRNKKKVIIDTYREDHKNMDAAFVAAKMEKLRNEKVHSR